MVRRVMLFALTIALALVADGGQSPVRAQGENAPLIVLETSQGTVAFVTFPNEAPLTVAHIVALAKSGFYDGQRIHRAVSGFLVQFGDPQSRDLTARETWGRGSKAASGKPVGAAEITKRRPNLQGAVGLAHMGEPTKGDSQIYITLARRADLDGQYAVFGQVVEGAEVLAQLKVGDEIRRAYIRD